MKRRSSLLALVPGALALLLCAVCGGDERRVEVLDGRPSTLVSTLRVAQPAPPPPITEVAPAPSGVPVRLPEPAGPSTASELAGRVEAGLVELAALLDTPVTLVRWERTAASLVKSWGPQVAESLLRASERELSDAELLAAAELYRQHALAHSEGRLASDLEQAFDRTARTRLHGILLDEGHDPDRRLFSMVALASLGTVTDSLALVPRLDHEEEGERRRASRALARSPHVEVAHALDERLRNGSAREIESILVTLAERARDVEAWGPHMAAWLEAPLRGLVEDAERPVEERRRALSALAAWGPEAVEDVALGLVSDLSLGRDDELLRSAGRELLSAAPLDRDRLTSLSRDPALEAGTRLSLLEELARDSSSAAESAGVAEDLLALLGEGLDFESRRRAVYALAGTGFDEQRFATLPELADLQEAFSRARRLRSERALADPVR